MFPWQHITRMGTSHSLHVAGPRFESGSEPCPFCCSMWLVSKALVACDLAEKQFHSPARSAHGAGAPDLPPPATRNCPPQIRCP